MPDFGIYAGDTDKTIYVRLRDSTTGLAKTGLAYNSAGAVCSYVLPAAARAAISLATQTVTGAHSDGGFVEVDATNCKGLYRLDLPDAAIASGAFTLISIEFDGIIEETLEIPLRIPNVNVLQISGDATAADNCELMFDGTGYAGGTTPLNVNTTQLSGDATAADNAEAFFDGTGYAGTNNVIPTVTTLTGHTAQTGDAYAVVNHVTYGNSALKTLIDTLDDYVDTEVAAILADTNELQTDWTNGGRLDLLIDGIIATLGVAGAGLTAVPWNAAWDAEVQSECADAVSAWTIADGDTLAANSVALWLRRMRWYIINKLAMTDATGAGTVYKDDGTTPAATLTVSDDSTTTTRTGPTWA